MQSDFAAVRRLEDENKQLADAAEQAYNVLLNHDAATPCERDEARKVWRRRYAG